MAKPSTERHAGIGDGVTATAALLVCFYLASRILGFVRQAVIASLFGVGPEADAWFAAFRIPDTLFTLFAGGALVSALIPVYTRYRDSDDRKDLRRLATGLFNLVAVFMIVVGALGAVFAQPLTDLIVPGFDEPTKELTARATRWLMLSPLLLGLAAVAKGISQSERRFLIPAAGPVFYNMGTIAGGVLLAGQHGIMGLVWGTVAGAFIHLAIQQVGLARIGIAFPFSTVVAHPGVVRVISLMVPRLLGFAVIQGQLLLCQFPGFTNRTGLGIGAGQRLAFAAVSGGRAGDTVRGGVAARVFVEMGRGGTGTDLRVSITGRCGGSCFW